MHLTIVQARQSSTRLPGKALLRVNGRTVLQHVLDRVHQSEHHGRVVVATSTHPTDDALAEHCHELGVHLFRGSLTDVLDRYHRCAELWSGTTITRVTADCPLLDPQLLDRVVETLRTTGADYVATSGWPAGAGQEAFTRQALQRAWRNATHPSHLEHVVTHMLDNPTMYHLEIIHNANPDNGPPLTLDTPADLERLKELL